MTRILEHGAGEWMIQGTESGFERLSSPDLITSTGLALEHDELSQKKYIFEFTPACHPSISTNSLFRSCR